MVPYNPDHKWPASPQSSLVSVKLNSWLTNELFIAWILAASAVLLQMLTNGRYGYFRDELYFLACSDHLAWGYVDFAPLVALLTHASRFVLGDSLHAIRYLPALAQGAEVVVTGLIARELGGKRFAIFLSCLCVLLAPVILGNATRLSMNPFEPLFWMGAVYFLLRAINLDQPKLLLATGILLGLGLENKHSTAFFLVSLTIGLLLTPSRRLLLSKWFCLAAAIAFLIFLPNLIWQYLHDFPTLEALRNVKLTHKNIELPPLPFLTAANHDVASCQRADLDSGSSSVRYFSGRAKSYRWMGIAYLIFLAIMMKLHGKDYYLAPIYPMLFAAGGVFWESTIATYTKLRWLKVRYSCGHLWAWA